MRPETCNYYVPMKVRRDIISGKRVAILVSENVKKRDLTLPFEAIHDAGGHADLILTEPKTPVSSLPENSDLERHVFPLDSWILSKSDTGYDALILPGRAVDSGQLQHQPQIVELIQKWNERGSLIAAICRAIRVVSNAIDLQGRKLTSPPKLKRSLKRKGANWLDHPVVVHHNLITSRTPDDLAAFNEALITKLEGAPWPEEGLEAAE